MTNPTHSQLIFSISHWMRCLNLKCFAFDSEKNLHNQHRDWWCYQFKHQAITSARRLFKNIIIFFMVSKGSLSIECVCVGGTYGRWHRWSAVIIINMIDIRALYVICCSLYVCVGNDTPLQFKIQTCGRWGFGKSHTIVFVLVTSTYWARKNKHCICGIWLFGSAYMDSVL